MKPIVVWTGVAACGTKYEHEIEIVTDGAWATAWPVKIRTGNAVELISRTRDTIEVVCNQDIGVRDTTCGGIVQFRLSDQGWTSDPRMIADLVRYGEQIEE